MHNGLSSVEYNSQIDLLFKDSC